MSDELPALVIRPVSEDIRTREMRFVRETCIKVRQPRRDGMPWSDWLQMHGPQVDAYLDGATVLVAERGGVLLGFVVARTAVVCMLYVKAAFRGDLIGLRLLAGVCPQNVQVIPGGGIASGGPALPAYLPTPSWGQWCRRHGLRWVRAQLRLRPGQYADTSSEKSGRW